MATAFMAPQGRHLGAFLDRRAIGAVQVKRWDGLAKSCGEWDCLRRDPELWFHDGNCLVHLYEKGHSRRGPSFKVPFDALVEAQCFPMIARFLSTDGHRPRTPREIKRLNRSDTTETIDLYIAPEAMATKEQTLQYHLATRNMFAWVFGLPLVGIHLGQALIGLLNSMHEFRSGLGDNLADMMEYIENVGYLDLTGNPSHSLAIAYFAEHFQMRDLYVRALTHCVGMNERLQFSSEYLHVDRQNRKLMRSLRTEMEDRLHQASDSLKNFLDEELSETYIGMPSGSRAHLERFRSFLLSHYTTRLGYYPPRIFDSNLLRMMREDFEALYELLVDNEYDTTKSMPPIAVGGICTLQVVRDFDKAHHHSTLEHPLPLLPYVVEAQKSRRTSWLPRSGPTKPNQRLLEHTALIKATNWKRDFFTNELVSAYRQFEEDTILSPLKVDRQERISLIDARKVRWLVVYAVYQVLKSVTEEPVEVQNDIDASYHLAISAALIPKWERMHELGFLLRSQTDMVRASSSAGTPAIVYPRDMETPAVEAKFDIRPDIDYLGLTKKHLILPEAGGIATDTSANASPVIRAKSLSRALSVTRRRSLMFFKSSAGTPPLPAPPAPRTVHHEIVVPGYGNGTNEVQMDEQVVSYGSWASRSDSTVSKTTSTTDSMFDELDETDDDDPASATPTSSVRTTGSATTTADIEHVWDAMPAPLNLPSKRRDVVSMMIPSGAVPDRRASLRRPLSAIFDLGSPKASDTDSDQSPVDDFSPVLSRSQSFLQRTTSMRIPDLRRRSFVPTTSSRRITDDTQNAVSFATDEKAEWTAMQTWLDGDHGRLEVSGRNGNGDAWGQYAELGGLTETK